MNTTELKALAEDLQINHEYCPKEVILKAAASILELIAANEDAQGEIRALRATEAGLRDRLAAVEADRAQRVPECRVVDVGFRFDGEAQQHVPSIKVEFEPVPVSVGSVGKGWKDRDALVALLASTPAQPAQQPKPSPIKAEHTTVYPSGTRVTRLELTDEAKESLRADVPHIPGQPVERKPMTDEVEYQERISRLEVALKKSLEDRHPMTETQRLALIDRAGDVTDGLDQEDFAQAIVDAVERHHGIKE